MTRLAIAVFVALVVTGPGYAIADTGPSQVAQNRGSIFNTAPTTEPDPAPLPPAKKGTTPAPASAWPAGLNAYFHADLTNPTPDQVMSVVASDLNRQTLAGMPPLDAYARFSDWLKRFRKTLPKREVETEMADGFYRNMVRWVELEAKFTADASRSVTKDLVQLVKEHAELDPAYDLERRDQIIQTIEQQGLFPPSGILFGFSVLPFRQMNVPRGFGLFEIVCSPQFTDAAGSTQALIDFLHCPGPVYRVDFDTVGANRFVAEMGDEDSLLHTVPGTIFSSPSGVRGPAILQTPTSARYLRVTVESRQEVAVLRNLRVFAVKEPPAAICSTVRVAPELDASFKESSWPQTAQIEGFILPENGAFAEAQTTVRLCRTDDTLYVGVYAREPRMDTMAVTMTARDAPLDSEESVEIAIEPPGRPVYRFATNPNGAQTDSRDGDTDWDGAWRVVAKQYPSGWAAEFAIPFADLGGPPSAGKDWVMDCIRTRRNVRNERSVWAYSADHREDAAGSLIFN
jgi:hypothetical protein